MNKRGIQAIAALALVLIAVYAGRKLLGKDRGDAAQGKEEPARASKAPDPAPIPGEERSTASAAPEPARPNTMVRRMPDEAARQKLLHAIREARTRRQSLQAQRPGSGSSSEPVESQTGATMDKEYIQSVIRDSIPLIRECYELAQETTPSLEGKLTIEFTIAGERDVGGLVEEARVISDNEISRHPVMTECMQETILSLEFEPPEGGGQVKVHYPFAFASDPEQARPPE